MSWLIARMLEMVYMPSIIIIVFTSPNILWLVMNCDFRLDDSSLKFCNYRFGFQIEVKLTRHEKQFPNNWITSAILTVTASIFYA